ncbi:hypothetical protein DRN46_06315 [Thermococci archaeon]|nr:MAG: hypothetical protein DRN46_06315 [Thermococci archaeon]
MAAHLTLLLGSDLYGVSKEIPLLATYSSSTSDSMDSLLLSNFLLDLFSRFKGQEVNEVLGVNSPKKSREASGLPVASTLKGSINKVRRG